MSNYSEIKKEYTNLLIRILKPLLYEGLQSNYNTSLEKYNKIQKNKNISILQIFQKTLLDIPLLNTELIETETNRIRSLSNCADYFDNLVRAVIKSNIILLSNKSMTINIKISDFIHKCYIECGKTFYTCPHLFLHDLNCHETMRNKMKSLDLIGNSIEIAIIKMLPMSEILLLYLDENENENEYINETLNSEQNSFGLCNDPNEIRIRENVLLNTDEEIKD